MSKFIVDDWKYIFEVNSRTWELVASNLIIAGNGEAAFILLFVEGLVNENSLQHTERTWSRFAEWIVRCTVVCIKKGLYRCFPNLSWVVV